MHAKIEFRSVGVSPAVLNLNNRKVSEICRQDAGATNAKTKIYRTAKSAHPWNRRKIHDRHFARDTS
jgi:hypothetical protein